MLEEAKQAKNAYMREWRRKNKEKTKKSQERYWAKKFNEAREEIQC